MERQPSAHALPHPALHERPSILDVIRRESIRIHNLPALWFTTSCQRSALLHPFCVKGSVHLGVKGFTLEWEVSVGFTLEWEGSIKPRVHLGVKRFTLEWEVSLGFTLE